ncbi:hypothetical protein B0H13DRAFT_2412721 [Mycena leptocephala]|nr:hypothetical protein B0H13DRAFT_2412721 [Mycena leptocephala]
MPDTAEAQNLVNEISGLHGGLISLGAIVEFTLKTMPGDREICAASQRLRQKINDARHRRQNLGLHQQKRNLRHYLGLDNKPQALKDMLSTQDDPSVGSLANPRVVWRNREITNAPAQQRILSDTKCRPEDDLIIDEDHGYMTVELGESVIFLSNVSDKIVIELGVLRGIASGSEGAIGFYSWLRTVVDHACSERRDVRPNHPGTMVQVGWNIGPRHAREYGLAKSYAKKLDWDTTVAHDGDAAAAMTLTWGICRSFLPIDLTRSIEEDLQASGLPRMATRSTGEGTGYRIRLDGREYNFPLVERAPPDGLVTRDYSSWSYINWALSFNVNRIVDPTARQIIPSSIQSTARFTRTSMKAKQPVTGGLVREDPSLWPECGGGNFVDLTLKVKVIQATGTILAHRPNTIHGTTRLCGARSCGFTIPFTERLLEGFKMSHSEMDIVSGEGEPEYGRDS